MSEDAPSYAGELVSERDGKEVVMQSLLRRFGRTDGRNLHIDYAGARATSSEFAKAQRNWSRSPRT